MITNRNFLLLPIHDPTRHRWKEKLHNDNAIAHLLGSCTRAPLGILLGYRPSHPTAHPLTALISTHS
jgi:hypothetical protein